MSARQGRRSSWTFARHSAGSQTAQGELSLFCSCLRVIAEAQALRQTMGSTLTQVCRGGEGLGLP